MIKITAELEAEFQKHYREAHELTERVIPLFEDQHSFVVMMVLADLYARWMMLNDAHRSEEMVMQFHCASMERYEELVEAAEKESLH